MISISELIQLQPITINEQSKLMALMERIYPPAYMYMWTNKDCNFYFEHFYNLNNLKKELTEAESEYYFVIYKSQLVGILKIHFNKPLKSMPNKSGCYLNRIYLSEETQGKGIANELMQWVEQKAKLKGNELIWLEAMDSKVQAIRFYQKQGFKKSHKTSLPFKLLLEQYRGMLVFYKVLH